MKNFYKCPLCGAEFCLKGRKWCEEGGDVFCEGQPPRPGVRPQKHAKTAMIFAGNSIDDLRALRKRSRR